MKRIFTLGILALFTLLLTGCGEKVEVPPANVGMILTKNGYKPEMVPPSKFRLEWCWFYCDKLVTLEVADYGMKESFQLFMPKDQLNMNFDIRFTLAVNSGEKDVVSLFDRVTSSYHEESDTYFISVKKVYATYGQPILRDVIRTVVAKYWINEVASNREKLNAEITTAVMDALENTPLSVKRIAFADVQFPKIIVAAKEAAAEKAIEIQKEEAQKQITMVRLQAELEQERMRRNIRKERAMAVLEENEIISKSVTESYLAYRRLEVLEELAKSGTAVFVPMEAIGTLGLQQRIFMQPTKQ